MPDRTTSLSARKEKTREKRNVTSITVQFSLEQIKQHFYDSLLDINNQIEVADKLSESGKIEECKDILRSQIVFLEGILDFYIHEISKYALVEMFAGRWEKSTNYANFQIPMITVEECLKRPESTTALLERLNIRFGAETYINPEQLGQQLSLIGMKLSDICKNAYPSGEGKTYLKALFHRRNQIAHQADRHHTDAVKEEIDKKYVKEAILFVTKLVEAVHLEALAKDNN